MSKQQHFVVVVEPDGQMWIDYDTAYVKFDGFYTFDSETEDWLDTQDDCASEYETASEKLFDVLMTATKEATDE